jgi:glycosyltransferase involved in cell wall biosynthesis
MCQDYKPVIVVPAFDRRESLGQLLSSINQAWFPDSKRTLIISLDGGAKQNVIELAESFRFGHGNVEIIRREANLGVKDHIMACADLTLKFGSVIVLEDDLIVGPSFYEFAMKALLHYKDEPSIAGVSLYSQRYNETAALPFEPLDSQWPVYFMKLGCSWGQAWSRRQWLEFKEWYDKGNHQIREGDYTIPENVKRWPDSSWKKSYIHFLIGTGRYIVYPYSSYTTNNSGQGGTHMNHIRNRFQVSLNISDRLGEGFELPDFGIHCVKYDAHMESETSIVKKWTGMDSDEVEMDLYGTKSTQLLQKKPFAITSKKVNHYVRSYPLNFRPMELNLRYQSGRDEAFFHLVDTTTLSGKEQSIGRSYYSLFEYFIYGSIKTTKFAKLYLTAMIKYIPDRLRMLFSVK